MKIIAFINAYTSGKSGGDVRAVEILKRRPEGAELTVVTSSLGKEFCQEEGLAAEFVATTREEKLGNITPLYLLRILHGLKLFLTGAFGELEPDSVVYSTSDALPDVLPAFLLQRRYGCRWFCPVYHLIATMSDRPGGYTLDNVLSYFSQKISLFLIKKGGALVDTETSFNKEKLVSDYGVAAEKILVVPSGIGLAPIDAVTVEGEPRCDFCYLARVHRSKGIYDLIRAWGLVCQKIPTARLGVGGGGTEEIFGELKEMVADLGLQSQVEFLGFLSEEDKYKLLKSSWAYVLPSYEEGIPITFYEAMYCGLPVVTYYLPTYCDIKDKVISVPVKNVEALAEAMLKVLQNEVEVEGLVEEGKRLVVAENTWPRVAEKFWAR